MTKAKNQLLFFDKIMDDKNMKSFSSAVENDFVDHDFVKTLFLFAVRIFLSP